MDWYYGSGINDSPVPNNQDLLERLPSPDCWSNWGISAPEGFNSPGMFFIMNTNPTEVEFNINDESCNGKIELEYSLHDKDQCTGSSVCGGLPEQSFQQTAFSYDQPNFQLQDLSRFEQMDDIFLDFAHEDLPYVENVNKSFYFYPDLQCSITPGGLQKDIAASKSVPCYSESNSCLDIETNRDKGMHEELSVEEFFLQDLEMIIAQFTTKSRICFRDALYRLARQEDVAHEQNGGHSMQKAMPQADYVMSMRSVNKKPMESRTNIFDRAVANLMFSKMEMNILDLPPAAPLSSLSKNEMELKSYKEKIQRLKSGTKVSSPFPPTKITK